MFNHHSIIPWGSFRGRQEEKWGSFRGQFGDHFRVGDHFGVRDHFGGCTLLASRRLSFRQVCQLVSRELPLIGWDNFVIPRHFQRLITGKLTGVDPGRPQNLQRRKVEEQVHRNSPIKRLTVTSNESKKNGENNTQIIMVACTWPSNSNLSQALKKATYLKLMPLLSR